MNRQSGNHDGNKVVVFKEKQRQSRRQTLERLFEEYGAPLRRFLRGHLVAREDLEDIVQEVFARFMEMEDLEARLSERTGSTLSFVFTIANNLVVDLHRRRKVQQTHELNEREAGAERVYEITPEASAAAGRELDMVKKVIMNMRPAWRKAFILSRFKNMNYHQIAKHMDVSVKQVEHYMAQAINRIRKAERSIKRKNTPLDSSQQRIRE